MEAGRGYRPDVVTDLVIDFIKERDFSKPFFANVWYITPHAPLHIPPDYTNSRNFDLTTPRGKLASMLHHVDGQIGRIIDTLETEGITDNTLVILTSDNGGLITPTKRTERLYRGFKQSLFEGGLRVPFVAKLPGVIPANSTNDYVSSFFDVFPTLLDFAGLQNKERMVGSSMLESMVNGQYFEGQEILWGRTDNWRADIDDESEYTTYAYRSDDLKLVKPRRHVRAKLYDVSIDPYETLNLFNRNIQKRDEFLQLFSERKLEITKIPKSNALLKQGATEKDEHGVFTFFESGDAARIGPSSYHEFSGTSGTIDFSVTIEKLPELGRTARILSKAGSYRISVNPYGKISVVLFGFDAGAQSKRIVLQSGQLELNREYKITLTNLFHKNTNNSYRLYIDHVLTDEIREEQSLYALGTLADGYLRLGSSSRDGNFAGKISHPQIYKTYLNQSEISSLK